MNYLRPKPVRVMQQSTQCYVECAWMFKDKCKARGRTSTRDQHNTKHRKIISPNKGRPKRTLSVRRGSKTTSCWKRRPPKRDRVRSQGFKWARVTEVCSEATSHWKGRTDPSPNRAAFQGLLGCFSKLVGLLFKACWAVFKGLLGCLSRLVGVCSKAC